MMQGLAGWMSLTGDPDGPPTKSGLSLVDLSGGYVSAIAVLAGLWRARRDGVGCDCDVSLFETALARADATSAPGRRRAGYVPPRRRNSAHPSIVPFQNFATADGWIVVACPKEKFWERLCDAIGRPELRGRRFPTFADRDRRRDELEPILEDVFRTRTSAEWLAVLGAAGVPSRAGQRRPRGGRGRAAGRVRAPAARHVRQVASPLRLSDAEPPVRPAPVRGEHTEPVLVELCGYEPERVQRARRRRRVR